MIPSASSSDQAVTPKPSGPRRDGGTIQNAVSPGTTIEPSPARPNDELQQRGQLERLPLPEKRHAGPVGCNRWSDPPLLPRSGLEARGQVALVECQEVRGDPLRPASVQIVQHHRALPAGPCGGI